MTRTLSAAYWAADYSDEYKTQLLAAEALGRLHARTGQKANAKGLYGLIRTFYFLGYKETKQSLVKAA